MIPIKVLALDQATNNTGFCLCNVDTKEFIEYGTVKANKKKETHQRIYDLVKWIEEYLYKQKPDYIVIEDIQNQRNNKIYKILAQMQGALINSFINLDYSYKVVPPVTWKTIVGIKKKGRSEEKEQSIEIASNAVHEPVHEDTADAICIALSEMMTLS